MEQINTYKEVIGGLYFRYELDSHIAKVFDKETTDSMLWDIFNDGFTEPLASVKDEIHKDLRKRS